MLTTVPRTRDNTPADYPCLIQVIARETALTTAAAYRAAWRTWQSLTTADIGQLTTRSRRQRCPGQDRVIPEARE